MVEVWALVSGRVEKKILLNEYLIAENETLNSKMPMYLGFYDHERIRLLKIKK